MRDGVASQYSAPDSIQLDGGAIYAQQTALALTNVNLVNNVATDDGGAVYLTSSGPSNAVGSVHISGSQLSGNSTLDDGGAVYARPDKYGNPGQDDTLITGSQVTGNRAGGTNFGAFGTSTNPEGGGVHLKYQATVTSSTIAGNTASTTNGSNLDGRGGGVFMTGNGTISNSTVSGNTAADTAGGAWAFGTRIRSSTVSGNTTPGIGGGILAGSSKYSGPTRIDDSTVSGNTATGAGPYDGRGGGVAVYSYIDTAQQLVLRNSTIASNSAVAGGGGIFGFTYQAPKDPGIELKSTIVADNTGAGAASDLTVAAPPGVSTSGMFAAGFSLIEAPGSVTPLGDPSGSNILGVDPGLSPLAANGGPTKTHALSALSPAIDAAQAGPFTTDQRGQARTVDAAASNSPLSDGTDMGAFEVQDPSATGDDDVTPPQTEITKAPKKLKLKKGKKLAKAKIKFTGTDDRPGELSFECKLDKGKFEPCSSPLKLKLDKGKHTLEVRAVDAAGNVDEKPAKAKIKVKRKKPKK